MMRVRRVPTRPNRISTYIPVSPRVFEVEGMYEATCQRLKMQLVLMARVKLRARLYLLYPEPVIKKTDWEYFIRDLTTLVQSARVEILNPQVIKRRPSPLSGG